MAKYTAKQIQNWDVAVGTKLGAWTPARPLNHTVDGWRRRVVLAWGVLTGKYDALDWQENPND